MCMKHRRLSKYVSNLTLRDAQVSNYFHMVASLGMRMPIEANTFNFLLYLATIQINNYFYVGFQAVSLLSDVCLYWRICPYPL